MRWREWSGRRPQRNVTQFQTAIGTLHCYNWLIWTIDIYMDIYNIINICILFSKFLLYNKVLTRTVSGKSPEYPETHMQYSRREPLSFVTPKYSRQNKIKPCFVCSFQFRNFSLYHFLLRFQPGSIVDFESPLGAQRTWIEDWRPSRH